MPETTTRRQTIDFLGFLRSQLSGLQGIPTLCYELIQNADDVRDDEGRPGASRITFDVCDDALYVENNGVFREIDFERMERVSWGNKREEAGTTGAFGVGFISVYQVTDAPEIFSSGRHWIFQPNAAENERILERRRETEFTRFRLPWAYAVSNVREELQIPPIDRAELDDFVTQISESVEAAALFLKQVTMLEVKRSGELVRRIETAKDGDAFLVADGEKTVEWRVLQGRFDWDAAEMRSRYGELIEQKRQPMVTLAVSAKPLDSGLLYAFLPSETRTGLPFHINADFYPSQDRKRILFERSYRSEWNNLAVECAATTLADRIDEVLDLLGPRVFWEFAERVRRASDANTLSPAFEVFWEKLKPQIRLKPTVLTASGKMLSPPETIILNTSEQMAANAALEHIGIDTVHPDLLRRQNLLLETGVRQLRISDVADALEDSGLSRRTELVDAPTGLQSEEEWSVLWIALSSLWERLRPNDRADAKSRLECCAIAFGSDGALWPPSELSSASVDTERLFTKLGVNTWFVRKDNDAPVPSDLVPEFGLWQGIDFFERIEERLEELWDDGLYSPQDVYKWLEGYRQEVTYSFRVTQLLRSCAIWPTADGRLKPLEGLYLAGDFDDPLELAQLIDVDALGGRREFLETALSVPRLDFTTYVRDRVPAALRTQELDRDSRLRLLQVLAENLGRLQGQSELQARLAELPLVWCGEDVFLPAKGAYFDSQDVRAVLGPQAQFAQFPETSVDAVAALYGWLGVAQVLRPEDLVAHIRRLAWYSPTESTKQSIEVIFGYLSRHWATWDEGTRAQFSPLKHLAWLPGTKQPTKWYDASGVYSVFSSYLFESQGNFLAIDRRLQQTRSGSDLLDFLGVKSEPTTELVVKHLLVMSDRGQEITQQIYDYLTRNAQDPAIRQLRNQACLYLASSSGQGRYFQPNEVFWEEHPFGQYRFRLGPDFGRFKDLLDQLGVKHRPDAADAISVLLDISAQFGPSNIRLREDKDDEKVVVNCWQLLTCALEAGEIEVDGIKKRLGDQKTIPDSRHILEMPQRLFFEDRPGWGAKFELIKNNLTARVQGAWPAMEAAGVRRLSKAIATELSQCANQNPNTDLKRHVSERKPLLQRVIEVHREKGITDFELQALAGLDYVKADEIELVRVFTGFGRQERSKLETVDAVHLDGTLYFSAVDSQYPWKGIARELAYVLHPSGELSSLGMELKEILSQSLEDARATLDEFGYPRIQEASSDVPPSDTVEIADVPIDTPLGPGGDNDTGGGTTVPHPATGVTSPPMTTPVAKPRPPKRKTSRLMSYVYPDDATSAADEPPEVVFHRNEVEKMGVDLAMAYERENGRDPTDMNTVQHNHPGYDIKSIDSIGQPRYIEVKATSGWWDSRNPAQVTRREFETARELGTSYWLYVIEQVETDQVQLHAVRNPANRVERYLFDYGWKPASE